MQFLAHGGMGEVYEAADEHLQGKHCALKTLRAERAADPTVRQRFEREVLLAREISHANVCPTYDLFREDSPGGPLLFLTMKLLRGESLGNRLARAGPFTPEAALPILRQMAAALDAAHRAGVIHRDFKPGNVMLESAGQEIRVSVTDFGLSRLFESDSTLAQTGALSGTVGYIAPELLQGRVASPASDVYALGVTVHEMLTGRKPHHKPGSPAFVSPSAFVKDLPRAWNRMILGCLEYDPSKRFQSAGEALSIIDSPSSASRAATLRRPASRRGFAQAAAGAGVLLAGSLWLSWPRLDALLHPLPKRRFVALMVWPQPAAGSVDQALSRGVLEAIGNRLARAEGRVKDLLVISPGDVVGQAPPKTPADAVGALGANLVLTASLASGNSGFTLSLNLLDPATGKVLRQDHMSCPPASVSLLPERASAAAAALLEVPVVQSRMKDQEELASVAPAAYQAFIGAEDLVALPNDAGLDQAIERYQKALELDPRFALGYAKLAMAFVRKFHLSEDKAALTLAGKNAQLALRYNPNSATGVFSQAVVYLYSGEIQSAIDTIGRALELDPGNPRILLYKASAFRDLDRAGEEEEAYREILKDRPNYWPASNELGRALYRHGKYREAAEAFSEAATVAPKVALPLTNLGAMYLVLGRRGEAAQAFQQSLQHAPNELAWLNLGNIEFEDGHYRKALEYYGQARDLKPKDDLPWRNIGDCYTMLGEPRPVIENYAKAADVLSERLKTNPKRGFAWMTLAFYDAKLGRHEQAEADLKTAEEHGATDVESQFTKAQALALLGRKEEALRLVLSCIDQGLSVVEVQLALDLKDLREDPRYLRHIAQLKPTQTRTP
ncbi:MAG: protein kinase domain-containing protein [Bryobacteraceae bacterium]